MDLNQIYENLSSQEKLNMGNSVKVRTGLFSENDLVNVFNGDTELYFKIDKQGLLEITNSLLSKISHLPPKDRFSHMIDIFNLLQKEINDYFGEYGEEDRLNFFVKNGEKTNDECVRICSLSQIKGRGIAQCAEKASLANNILLILNSMGLFDYKINYLNALTSINNSYPEGHAFLHFDKKNKNGQTTHLIYDITNPEIVIANNGEYYYPALYQLNEEEFSTFMNGGSFDNSKFIMINYYQPKENRIYRGFSKSSSYKEDLENIREQYKEMMNESTTYDFVSTDDGTLSNYRTLPEENKSHIRR